PTWITCRAPLALRAEAQPPSPPRRLAVPPRRRGGPRLSRRLRGTPQRGGGGRAGPGAGGRRPCRAPFGRGVRLSVEVYQTGHVGHAPRSRAPKICNRRAHLSTLREG